MSERGLLSATSSLTNLSSEPDTSLPRCRSASEVFDPSSASIGRRSKARQRAKDLRHSVVDCNSDYYNNRRPQSVSLSSQVPAFSTLQSASSVSALGTISENETLCDSSITPYNSDHAHYAREPFFTEQSDTPIFRYTPTPVVEPSSPVLGSTNHHFHTRQPQGMSNPGPKILGSGSHQLSRSSDNGYAESPTTTAATIHVSEPVSRQLVPLFLNPRTGQMYSRDKDYFRPISSHDELLSRPPKPDKRSEEVRTQPTYIKFTQFLAILFFLCGNFAVLAACSVPALLCARKVRRLNLKKNYREAKKHSEYVLCFNILGIVLHVLLMVAAIIVAVVVAVIIIG